MPGEFSRVYSAALRGVGAVEVELEVNETGSANSAAEMQDVTVIVGLPDTAVRESRARVWTAIAKRAFPGSAGGCTIVNRAPRFFLIGAMNPCLYGLQRGRLAQENARRKSLN